MLEVAVIGIFIGGALATRFIGGALATRFRVLVFVVAIPVVMMVIVAAGATYGRSSLWIAIAMAVAAASVQLGYIGGGMLPFGLGNRRAAATPRKQIRETPAGQH